MLRVRYHPLSTYSQRVRIALLEKNIPAELVEVDLPARAQFRPEYLAGDRFTLAEVCYAPFLQFLPTLEVTPGPAIQSWAARILERPSVRETRPPR